MQRCNGQAFASFPSPTSTLDSIQCHSISQCNAHAAAYRCTAFRNETTAVSAGTSLLSVSLVIGAAASIAHRSALAAVHQGITREYGTRPARPPLFHTDFIFQLQFVVYSRRSVCGAAAIRPVARASTKRITAILKITAISSFVSFSCLSFDTRRLVLPL